MSDVELTSKLRIRNILNTKDVATVKQSAEWGRSAKCGLSFILINSSVWLPAFLRLESSQPFLLAELRDPVSCMVLSY